MTDASELGRDARDILRSLECAGLEPSAREHGGSAASSIVSAADRSMLGQQARRGPTAPVLAVHQYSPPAAQLQVQDAVNVARGAFCTDSIPRKWCAPLLAREELWVPSAHSFDSFRRGGIPESKLRILGTTIDFDAFSPAAQPAELGSEPGRFVFLSTFDGHARSGFAQLLRAWSLAFGPDDPVCLVLIAENGAAEFEPPRFSAPIEVRPVAPGHPSLPGIYAAAGAYVLASHGEALGRRHMEAMAMGLPTVGPRFGAALDFMDDENSWLFDGRMVEVPRDAGLAGVAGHRWFDADVESLAALLRSIARDPQAARAKAAGGRAALVQRFGSVAAAARVEQLAGEAVESHYQRRSQPPLCVMRGPFGSNASLAGVNDGLADAFAHRGHNVIHRAQRAGPFSEPVPGISHSWPPDFEPASFGPSIVILPFEFGAPPREWVERAPAWADRIWVPSEYVRRGYVEGGMPPGLVEVVPNGVDLERFSPEGARRELPQAGCTFLFVGGSIWRKGVDILLDAWVDAFAAGDDVQLVVKDMGTSTHYRSQTCGEEIRRLAKTGRAAPIVYIDDELAPAELAPLYRAADVMVTPYRGEGFCLPALEAMACGLPVIHNAVGPTREFVPDDGGWALPAERAGLPDNSRLLPLVSPGYVHEVDHDALVAALREAAANPHDREARGLRALAAAQSYSWDSAAEIAERSLASLREEALPLAREIAPAKVESRGTLVLYSPDWNDEPTWSAALAAWAEAIGADDPVTLALQLSEGDPSDVAGRVLRALERAGFGEHDLPDLALCEPGSASLASLVAAAHAVLLDGTSERPELTRRAAALLHAEPEPLAAFADSIRSRSTQTLIAILEPS